MKIFSFSGSFRKNETILKEFGYVEVVVQLSTSARPILPKDTVLKKNVLCGRIYYNFAVI